MYNKETKYLVRRLYNEHKNLHVVSQLTKIPVSTVHRWINMDENSPKGKPGPKSKLSERDLRLMKRVVHTLGDEGKRCTSRIVKEEASLGHVSTRTVRRALSEMDFKYKKVAKEISLTHAHKENRVMHCRKWLEEAIDWKTVIFTDEKRFTLEGPDNWSSYIDLERKNTRDRVRCGGGGYMIWGMISSTGLFWIKFLDGNINSEKYIEVLTEAKCILDENFGDDNYIFQQDNCSVHTSAQTKKWITEANMCVLEWPAKSPDLNLIENIWSYLSYKVYTEKVKFPSLKTLKNAIETSVKNINAHDSKYIETLYLSMNKRLVECIERKGAITDY